ncbi:MAG: amidohydrolase [Synergistota bacterium]|nr:amidohydrolase [Synergistota bacterium]
MLKRIKEIAGLHGAEITALRRHFHMYPELGWEEMGTTDKIAEVLGRLGCTIIKRGFGGTGSGLVAEIIGGKPGGCVGLRADIDALPLQEENDAPYASRNPGVMHACGHDAHAAMLLGAAMVLSEIKDEIPGTVRLLFQPAEESGLKSGAAAMVDEGALDGVDSVGGIHVWSKARTGTALYRSGPVMAAADGWYLVIKGRGGHGSTPELTIDPTITAANLALNLQAIVGREVSAKETAVISIGVIKAGDSAFNIIPDTVTMNGTVRTFNPEVKRLVEASLRRVIAGLCEAGRCDYELDYRSFIPATINDHGATMTGKAVCEEILGPDNVTETELIMGSEDYSYFLDRVPGTYIFLGTANPDKGSDTGHHHPKFDVDEDALPAGAAILAGFAWRRLVEGS